MPSTAPVALVTGANRGLGIEVCRGLAQRGFHVILTARDGEKAREAAEFLRAEGLELESAVLDVTSERDTARLVAWVEHLHGRLDVLVNNAGISLERERDGSVAALAVEPDLVALTFEVNALGPLRVTQAFAPLLRASRGAVVNVSSGLGQLAEMGGGRAGYRLSKAALNALTRVLAAELAEDGVRVNAVCPGWVRTDMGGPGAPRSLEEGAAGILWAATLPPDGPTGGFFRDREPLPW